MSWFEDACEANQAVKALSFLGGIYIVHMKLTRVTGNLEQLNAGGEVGCWMRLSQEAPAKEGGAGGVPGGNQGAPGTRGVLSWAPTEERGAASLAPCHGLTEWWLASRPREEGRNHISPRFRRESALPYFHEEDWKLPPAPLICSSLRSRWPRLWPPVAQEQGSPGGAGDPAQSPICTIILGLQ